MGLRRDTIARSVQYAVLHEDQSYNILAHMPAFFYAYWLNFGIVRNDLFRALRGVWAIDGADYRSSFEKNLHAQGDMGYSGSTFFATHDRRYVIKSIPRRFEHTFFRDDLLLPYAEYMVNAPASLLVRITDFLQCAHHSIGSLCGLVPSHHIVMENILQGEDEDEGWETFDLKPMSYFFPERDVAGGALASEATKSKLADHFDGKIQLTLDQAEEFRMQLAKDTRLLANHNAVDYSLFVVRIPSSASVAKQKLNGSWRTGVKTVDGEFIYRAVILDFFWAKHKTHAKAMTGLINTYNLVDRQGPMSVTTDAPEYRERFLKMCQEIVEVKGT